MTITSAASRASDGLDSTATLKIFVSGNPPSCTGNVLAELTDVDDAFRLRPEDAIERASSGVRQKNSSSTEDESQRGTTPCPPLNLHDDFRVTRFRLWPTWKPPLTPPVCPPPSLPTMTVGERKKKREDPG
jgi:hypothetical protein